MDQAGLVLATVAGLWLVYLVPQLLQDRRRLAEARVDDRFSEHLRVLRAAESVPTPAGTHAPSQSRVQLHPRGGDRAMYRPQSVGDRVSADAARLTAAERAARAAAPRSPRRGRSPPCAPGRPSCCWPPWPAGWPPRRACPSRSALTPTVLLVAVLVAGRSAVLAAHRADAAWAAGAARRAARPRPRTGPLAVGRAAHPSEAITEILQQVPVGPIRATAEEILATGEVPVVADDRRRGRGPAPCAPRCSTTRRSTRPRRRRRVGAGARAGADLHPQAGRASSRAATADRSAADGARSCSSVPRSDVTDAADAARPTTGGLQLDAILARRRASGE